MIYGYYKLGCVYNSKFSNNIFYCFLVYFFVWFQSQWPGFLYGELIKFFKDHVKLWGRRNQIKFLCKMKKCAKCVPLPWLFYTSFSRVNFEVSFKGPHVFKSFLYFDIFKSYSDLKQVFKILGCEATLSYGNTQIYA